MTTEELRVLPKIELHCHLDGSLSRRFLEKRLGRAVEKEEISASPECKSLVEYLEKFDLPCSCLMDEEGLREAGEDILETMSQEHVIYAEIRFAPMLSVTETMHAEQVVSAVLCGMEAGRERYGVDYQVILCLMRHHSYEQNLSVINVAEKFLGKGVCAIDLAGAEAQYPMSEFVELFEIAGQRGIPATVHAGECGEVQNIIDSVKAGAARIGHGIAMRNNLEVQEMIRMNKIAVEMCPISNLQTKAVPGTEEYPMREFLDRGILVTVNTDNRTVSDTSLTKELEFIQKTYGITDEEIRQMMRNAAEAAFVGPEKKKELLARVE